MNQPLRERVLDYMENVISIVEKPRLGMVTLFFWVLAIAVIRTITEAIIFDYRYGDISYTYVFIYAHMMLFYFTVFVLGVFTLKLFTREKLAKIANLSAIGFLILPFPPLIDYLFSPPGTIYTYIPKEKLLSGLTFFYHNIFPDVAGYGLLIEIIFILIATSLYVYVKTRCPLKAIGNLVLLNTLVVTVSTPTLNPLLDAWSWGPLAQPAYVLRASILSIMILTAIAAISNKRLFISLLKSLALLRTTHFVVMVLVGILIADHVTINFNAFTTYHQAGNIGMVGIAVAAIVFLWQYAVIINNVYDVEIDRVTKKERILAQGLMSRQWGLKLAVLFAIVGVGLSATLSWQHVSLALACIALSTLYSVPPVRFRDHPLSPLVIGAGSAIAFYIGYLVPTYTMDGFEVVKTLPEMTTEAVILGLLIFIALSIGSMTKDIDDYQGDKKEGVKNIFTIYGIDTAVTIMSLLLIVAFLSPLLLFHTAVDVLLFIAAGAIAVAAFRRFRRSLVVFPLYFFVLLYAVMRWFGVLSF
ncbi:MAG: UbiA family prenyltransferase [Thermoplasmatota archaeon]